MRVVSLQGLLVCLAAETTAFVIHTHTRTNVRASRIPLAAAKGFGNTQKDERDAQNDIVETSAAASVPTATTSPVVAKPSGSANSQMNAGQKALEKLRRERQAQKDDELRKVKEILEVDKMLQEAPEKGVIPEKVATRMGARMLPFVGIPLFGSLLTFVGFWYLTTVRNLDIQPTMVGATTSVLMVLSLFGITYSVLSASWDIDKEGSFLGVDEFKQNLGNVRDGLSRARENTLVREKMQSLPEEEIQVALKDLERRESSKQTLESKLDKELE